MKYYVLICIVFGAASAALHPWENPEKDSHTDGSKLTRTSRVGTTCNCGWVNKGRIVGGKETQKNEYPLVVSLEKTFTRFPFCGGTIITPWHVLTAAHCTHGLVHYNITVHAGFHNFKETGRSYIVAKIIEHEEFDSKLLLNDISILVTGRQILFNQNIGPACLPTHRVNLEGKFVKALGWGLMANKGDAANALREVDLPVISHQQCLAGWKGRIKQPQEATNVCTYESKKDTCQGDSGGPLIWLDPATNRYTLVALVSYGGVCGGLLPAVNTDIGAFASWINNNIASSKPGITACTKA